MLDETDANDAMEDEEDPVWNDIEVVTINPN